MNALTRDELKLRMAAAHIKLRLRRIVRFVPEEITDWESRDFLAVMDRSRKEGVLIFDGYTAAFDLSNRKPNANGRIAAIICDICASWRRGPESAVITFRKNDKATVSHLVCADLDCSLHVRGITTAGTLARTQIREDILPEGRINRLRERLRTILVDLSV